MTEKISIPLLLKHDFTLRAYSSIVKGFLYAIREKHGGNEALETYLRVCTMDDRIKNLTNALLDIFQLKGSDAETIGKWFEVWFELTAFEYAILEQSKTSSRVKVTKCPFKTEPKDLSDWALIFTNLVSKTINPKATVERPKAMCAGDSYCEYIWKIEE
ncbi:hypothetical protein [Candidatus Borrarchaeum sp.]|uniref:hypothetical protein n=1 Tax=Candidatus Borrarchaeum sp. TaxID=2846742 RepID=UPI00257DABAD|nr:hypothetical protein [Candidatus Borrarchaeum sp.]